MVFDAISFSIDEVFSINPSASVFVFGNFNVHHKECLIYSGGINISSTVAFSHLGNSDHVVLTFHCQSFKLKTGGQWSPWLQWSL